MVYDFAARDTFKLPGGMMAIYVALVGAYAADKEIRRWIGNAQPSRNGVIYVYLWLLFFLVAFVIKSFNPSFTLPDDLAAVCLQVLALFFGSKASKKIYQSKTRRSEEILTREQTVLAMMRSSMTDSSL